MAGWWRSGWNGWGSCRELGSSQPETLQASILHLGLPCTLVSDVDGSAGGPVDQLGRRTSERAVGRHTWAEATGCPHPITGDGLGVEAPGSSLVQKPLVLS